MSDKEQLKKALLSINGALDEMTLTLAMSGLKFPEVEPEEYIELVTLLFKVHSDSLVNAFGKTMINEGFEGCWCEECTRGYLGDKEEAFRAWMTKDNRKKGH